MKNTFTINAATDLSTHAIQNVFSNVKGTPTKTTEHLFYLNLLVCSYMVYRAVVQGWRLEDCWLILLIFYIDVFEQNRS